MTTYTSAQYVDTAPTSTEAGEQMVFCASYTFAAATALVANDIIKLAKLPANHVLTDLRIETDALGASCAGSAGFLNASATDMSQTVIAATSLALATILTQNVTAGLRVAAATSGYTPIGIKITTANTVDAALGAKITITMKYRPKQNIEV
jgi:hypothetical protein